MCLPQILTSDIYERAPRYPGEPRRNRLSMIRPASGRRMGYRDLVVPRDMMDPYQRPIGMGMGHTSYMNGHMGSMNCGLPPPPPPPPLPMLPPPASNYNSGIHSSGMQQPMNQFNGGGDSHGVVQFSGNDMGGQFGSGMDNRMHSGQFNQMGGQRYSGGPRSPIPRGMRRGYSGGGWGNGSIDSFSDNSYGGDRGMFQRHSYGSMDDMYGPQHRGSYAGY